MVVEVWFEIEIDVACGLEVFVSVFGDVAYVVVVGMPLFMVFACEVFGRGFETGIFGFLVWKIIVLFIFLNSIITVIL